MHFIEIAYVGIGLGISTILAFFLIASVQERRLRAVMAAAAAYGIFATGWLGSFLFFSPLPIELMLGMIGMVVIGTFLFFAPLGETNALKSGAIRQRVDERTIMFAREEYEPGTEKYNVYYAMHPEHKEVDDRLRQMPSLMSEGSRYYDPEKAAGIRRTFGAIKKMLPLVDGAVAEQQTLVGTGQMTRELKDWVLEAGAAEVGATLLNPMFVYSHVGRGPETWGQPIELDHKYAIVFSLEMDYEQVETAPDVSITEETARNYLKAAQISVELARRIRALGYPARAHISESNYQIMLPPVAHDAGLGELGRFGYLISPRLGARLRLGAVTTDLALDTDKPIDFGVQDFCARCSKCADNCPPSAIGKGRKTNVLGVDKWPLDTERCLHFWRLVGTDCGLCMKVCPFSHPPTLIHNLIRTGIKRSSFARMVSVWGDDLFYGRKDKLAN